MRPVYRRSGYLDCNYLFFIRFAKISFSKKNSLNYELFIYELFQTVLTVKVANEREFVKCYCIFKS